MTKPKPPQGALSAFWAALGPWGKRCTALLPIFAVMAILAPWASSMIGIPPFANKIVEARVDHVEQRMDLSERIAIQREIHHLEDEALRKPLSESEKNYLRDLQQRLKELEMRKK